MPDSLSIPGAGWDTESIVSGYIQLIPWRTDDRELTDAITTIKSFPFDYPFTDIFCSTSSARYAAPVIGFTGSYKQLEETWSEWLWRFADLLSRLDASTARVNLDCILGSFTWRLGPRPAEGGARWVIIDAPANDFSIHPDWLAHIRHTLPHYHWDRFVERACSTPA